MRALPFVGLVVLVLAAGGARLGAQPRGGAFTAAERATLEAGGLVVRRRLEDRAGAIHFGGTSWQRIERPPDAVWRAVRDPSRYGEMLPRVHAVRTVARSEREAVVRIEHVYAIVHAAYHLRIRFDDARRDVSFELDPSRPNDVRAVHGFLTLQRWPGERRATLVTWGILAAIDEGLLGGIVRSQVHDWMLRVPATMRAYLEGRGRTLSVAETGPVPLD